MRLFVVGSNTGVMSEMVNTALSGILVMHEREKNELVINGRGNLDLAGPLVVIDGGYGSGASFYARNWVRWIGGDSVTSISLDQWQDDGIDAMIDTAFRLNPTHLIAFYDGPEDISGYDRLAYAAANEAGIPAWTFRVDKPKE